MSQGILCGRRAAVLLALATALLGCGRPEARMQGTIQVDGSSTVFPLTEAVAEEFQTRNPGVHVTVGISGTGGGFKKFCRGETDLSNASRPIKPSEIQACSSGGVRFVELPVAYDAIVVVVNPQNTWARSITLEELRRIWEPAAQDRITRWSQVRPGWPDVPLKLYGPGTDSGTFDYFTEAVVGKEDASRGDYTASEDDNVLVQGVSRDRGALGYFGLAYYLENRQQLKELPIDAGRGPVEPTPENVRAGVYPLARPIFIYVRADALDRPEVAAFTRFYLENAPTLAETGFVPLDEAAYQLVRQRLEQRITGTMFAGDGQHMSLLERLRRSAGQATGAGNAPANTPAGNSHPANAP